MMPPHTLVVGGTGMLRGVCLALAARGQAVSVVARSHAGLAGLMAEARGLPGGVYGCPADYGDENALALAIRSAIIARGGFSLAICWIHASAPRAMGVIAGCLEGRRVAVRLFEVSGSDAADPARAGLAERGEEHAGVLRRRIVLGFVMEPGGSRWLRNEEIVAGVVRATDADAPESVIGVVRPWEARP